MKQLFHNSAIFLSEEYCTEVYLSAIALVKFFMKKFEWEK